MIHVAPLHWWSEKIGRRDVVARDNSTHGFAVWTLVRAVRRSRILPATRFAMGKTVMAPVGLALWRPWFTTNRCVQFVDLLRVPAATTRTPSGEWTRRWAGARPLRGQQAPIHSQHCEPKPRAARGWLRQEKGPGDYPSPSIWWGGGNVPVSPHGDPGLPRRERRGTAGAERLRRRPTGPVVRWSNPRPVRPRGRCPAWPAANTKGPVRGPSCLQMVEAAGIEPASAGPLQPGLHA